MVDLLSAIPTFIPSFGWMRLNLTGRRRKKGAVQRTCRDGYGPPNSNYTIFEGTSEIQRLVLARAISGVHIQ
jgi:hypothetical protein